MAGHMRGDLVKVESSGATGVDAVLRDGVRQRPDIDALATRSDRQVAIMVWNYHDDDLPTTDSPVTLVIGGLPATRLLVRHYRIDSEHSNSFTTWKRLGKPQNPSPEQLAQLESAGQLQLLSSPEWLWNQEGQIRIEFPLPRQAVSLIELSW
jgi:xylan 1,4-beta-xylosidase